MRNKKVDNRRVREIYHINRLSSPLPYQGEGASICKCSTQLDLCKKSMRVRQGY